MVACPDGYDEVRPKAAASVTDVDQQLHSIALFSDGSLMYDDEPYVVGKEPVILSESKTGLLGILLERPDTPLLRGELQDLGYLKDYADHVVPKNERLEVDLWGLGRIKELGSHLVRLGKPSVYARYIFTSAEHDLAAVTAQYGSLLGYEGFDLESRNTANWYSMPSKNPKKNNLVMPPEGTSFSREADRVSLALNEIEELRKELPLHSNLRKLIIKELLDIPRGGQQNIANIIARLRDTYSQMQDVSDDELFGNIGALLSAKANPLCRFVPGLFELRPLLTESERQAAEASKKPVQVPAERLYIAHLKSKAE